MGHRDRAGRRFYLDPLATAKQYLSERALYLDGIESWDGAYKQVSEATKECGIGEHSSLGYKMLPKFAHPTAMRIWASPDEVRGPSNGTASSARAVSFH